MAKTGLRLVGEGFPPHPQSSGLLSLRIEFGPAFAGQTSMKRSQLIEVLRKNASVYSNTLPGQIMTHIANYMESYADQLSDKRKKEYLNGTVRLVVENSFYSDGHALTFDTATGCSFAV